jgi:hypothetical protein
LPYATDLFDKCLAAADRAPSLRGVSADDEGVATMLQKIANFASHRERRRAVSRSTRR